MYGAQAGRDWVGIFQNEVLGDGFASSKRLPVRPPCGRTPRNMKGTPLGAWGMLTQPGYPIKAGVNSRQDPIRTDIWDQPAPELAAAATS